jgi:predicted secreted Zn-dependent protease
MLGIRLALTALILSIGTAAVGAETIVSKSYSYYPVGGKTAAKLEEELWRGGPELAETGNRHPGATRIRISREISFEQSRNRCAVGDVTVKLDTLLTLPNWTDSSDADRKARLVWRTLSSDIKRHEERHAEIARQWSRKLETALRNLRPEADCVRMQAEVEAVSKTILEKHAADHERFDRVEAASFERRIRRILRYKAKQMETGG